MDITITISAARLSRIIEAAIARRNDSTPRLKKGSGNWIRLDQDIAEAHRLHKAACEQARARIRAAYPEPVE